MGEEVKHSSKEGATGGLGIRLPTWREAAVWALLAAIFFEVGLNLLFRRSIWHRVENLEEHVRSLNHTRELEELRTRQQLDELRQKSDSNKQELDEIDEKVKKKVGAAR